MEPVNACSTEMHMVKIDAAVASEQETIEMPRKREFLCGGACPFSKQEYNTSDATERSKTIVKLCGLIAVYTVVMVIQVVGGLRANSLAILTDAAHLLSDVAGFAVSLFAVHVSGWDATPRQSFGFNRLEVIGALLSVQLIWLVSGTLIYEAVQRLITKRDPVNGKLMFAIAAFGFVVNLLLVVWLGHDHSHHGHDHSHHGHDHHSHHGHDHSHHTHHSHHACGEEDHNHVTEDGDESGKLVSASHEKTEMSNINIQGAYLHLVTDLIQSVGVMIGGCIIWVKPTWLVVDLACTLIFSVVALGTTLPMLRNVFYVLMERAPNEIDVARLESDLKLIRGVCDVHDLHVWAITVGKHVLACHVVIGPEVSPNEILNNIKDYCEQAFKISHITIQLEQE